MRRFKSLKEVNIISRRINLFISKPLLGLSNFIEAHWLLGKIEALRSKPPLRFESILNLFHDDNPLAVWEIVAYGELKFAY